MTRNRGDPTIPYRTPAIMGMAIAMDREYYHEIGEFDKGLDFWGGENAELSLRVRFFVFTFFPSQNPSLN